MLRQAWAQFVFVLLGWLASPTLYVKAQECDQVQFQQAQLRHEREESLIHRRLDLAEVQCFAPNGQVVMPRPSSPAHLLLINLWSIRCEPCRKEFPRLRNIVSEVKRQGLKIDFLFVADPPEETSEQDVQSFWLRERGALPDSLPCRSKGARLRASLGVDGVPVTLLVDANRVIRQAFFGSIEGRKVASAIERLLSVTESSSRRTTASLTKEKSPRTSIRR